MIAAMTIAGVLGLVAQARSADPLADATPAVGGVSLPVAVNAAAVGIELRLSDAESGIVAVRASNDGSTFGEWAAPPGPAPGSAVGVLPWVLSEGDGPKTVVVEVRNGGGAVSSFTATTVLDTAPPLLTGSEPADGATLAAPPPLLVVHYSEPLAASPLPTATMPGGPGFAVSVAGADVRLTPRRALLPGAAYELTVDGVRDLAGNAAAAARIDFTVDPGMTTLRVTATPATVVFGDATLVRGTVSRPGVAVTLSRQRLGESAFTTIATTTASAAGVFTFRPTPAATLQYRVDFAGDEHWRAASAALTVKVRPRIRLTVSPLEFILGGSATLRGLVTPVQPGATVVVQRLTRGTWTDWRALTLNSSSRFATVYRPTGYGLRTFRVHINADADHVAGSSTARRLVVDNPNPHHISIMFGHFIVIDISECHLYYYEAGRVVRRIDVVLGKPSTPTPRGQWAVYGKSVNPGGPFGVYAMFYHRGYGIHGTNQPWLLSLWPRYYSHGCCRMSNANITWLFPRCPSGTPVRNVF